jgi:hypothetical protein
MKRNAFLIIATVLVFSSCTTSKEYNSVPATLQYYPQLAMMNAIFGNTQDENPYIEPRSLLKGRENEFVVLGFYFNLPAGSTFEIEAHAINDELGIVAEIQSIEQMGEFWSVWTGNEKLNRQRDSVLSQTYVPSLAVNTMKKRSTYYVVLMGKYPIPRPTIISGKLIINGSKIKTFKFELPELKLKKPVTIQLE